MVKTDKIRVVALDVYGTILSSIDYDNEMIPRKGINEFLCVCEKKKVLVVGASDGPIMGVKMDLRKDDKVDISKFYDFYRMNQLPVKDFELLINCLNATIPRFNLKPRELLVIGDSYKDVQGAIEAKCCYIKCPEYEMNPDDFDFMKIPLEIGNEETIKFTF